MVDLEGVEAYDSITSEFCADTKAAYGDYDDHLEKGGSLAVYQNYKSEIWLGWISGHFGQNCLVFGVSVSSFSVRNFSK